MSTNAENIWKIGPVFSEIFSGICQFFCAQVLEKFQIFSLAK